MKFISILLIGLASFKLNAQTAIVIVRTPDTLFVGVDSRVAYGDYQRHDTACKIISRNHFFYTFAGYSFENSLSNLIQYFPAAKTIDEAASQYLRNRTPKLLSQLHNLFNKHNDFYVKNYNNHRWTETVFFGIENNHIVTKQVYFELVSKPNEHPILDTGIIDMTNVPDVPKLFHVAGHKNAIEANLNLPGTWSSGIPAGIEKLIALQSKATPAFVSLPIDIIILTKSGTKWICPTGVCYQQRIIKNPKHTR